jgi:tRNA (adenine57-N1/adenine58-N1)-methyltransferase
MKKKRKPDMRIVLFREAMGILDDASLILTLKGENYKLSANASVSCGDTIRVNGKEGLVTEFNPSMYSPNVNKTTQTIKPADYSYMIAMSGIRSGSTVLEAGVGSGQLSIAILWIIGMKGKLVSVDTSEKNIDSSRKNIEKFICTENWFPVIGDIRSYSTDEDFDSVFLDIPDPWNCTQSLKRLMKPRSSLVTYSPNYNQTEKTVIAMESNGFYHVETCEILKRDLLVREGKTRPSSDMLSHTAFLSIFYKRSGFSFTAGKV